MVSMIILLASLIVPLLAAPPADKVTSLPGTNFTVPFDHYSGYLKASATKYFHYWFTKAQTNPDSSPVLLWLNGGPGCSSLGGLIEELGPFHVSDNGSTVYLNPYAWNNVGNVIFMESPAGVGFSYDSSGNVATNDDEVATNNYNALIDFFTNKFPEYKNSDFYITGESYGGVYIPTLAVKVAADKVNFPHFKGVAIGNGIFSFPLNYNTIVPLYYYHGLVRQTLYDKVVAQCCNGNSYKCNYYGQLQSPGACNTLLNQLYNQGPDLDPYNLYNTCYLDGGSSSKRSYIERMLRKLAGLKPRDVSAKPRGSGLPLCAQSGNTEFYLNRADVRAALHIPSSVGHWTDCSDIVGEVYTITHDDVSAEFKSLINSGIRILTYNGDVDTVCNFALNKQFINNLGLTVHGNDDSIEWTYHGETPNVAGFVTRFSNNVDFVTVRGSGHFVPENRPRESLQLIYNFIHQRDYSLPAPF